MMTRTLLPLLLTACQPEVKDSADSAAPDLCAAPAGELAFDAYGGDTRVTLEATGFFHTAKLCERWWLVTPEGHPFYSFGVNHISPTGDTNILTGERVYEESVDAAYASDEAWADAVVQRFQQWSLNTAGCWSNDLFLTRLPQTISLSMAPYDWYTGEQGDLFDPAWEEAVETEVNNNAAPHAEEPYLMGWFLDNEVAWGPDWHDLGSLLEKYLRKGPDSPGKAVAVQSLLEPFGDVAGLNAAVGSTFADEEALLATTEGWDGWLDDDVEGVAAAIVAFRSLAAERYFTVTTEALRAADPNHLILGNREISVMAPMEVYQAAAAHLDVISINNYVFIDGIGDAVQKLTDALDPSDGFAALHNLVDLPVLITEFGFRADDAGLPNSYPPIYPNYATQEDRADAFAQYARFQQSIPWIIGYHWFEWVDQPVDGRSGDGEDNNWGLVDEQDQVYPEITARMAEVNAELWQELALPLE